MSNEQMSENLRLKTELDLRGMGETEEAEDLRRSLIRPRPSTSMLTERPPAKRRSLGPSTAFDEVTPTIESYHETPRERLASVPASTIIQVPATQTQGGKAVYPSDEAFGMVDWSGLPSAQARNEVKTMFDTYASRVPEAEQKQKLRLAAIGGDKECFHIRLTKDGAQKRKKFDTIDFCNVRKRHPCIWLEPADSSSTDTDIKYRAHWRP